MNFDMFELINNEEILLGESESNCLQFSIIYDGIGGELKYYPETDEFEITTYITEISDYELDEEDRIKLKDIIEEYCFNEVGTDILNLYEFLTGCYI